MRSVRRTYQMNGWLLKPALLMLILLLTSCAAKNVSQRDSPSENIKAAPVQDIIRQSWQEKWDNTVAAAKKEGKVVILFSGGAEVRVALSKAFFEKYGIDLDIVSGSGGELVQKLRRE